MAETHFTAGMSALWIQPDGDNTAPLYLGCHELGDITVPYGDTEPIYCPDPARVNKFRVVGSIDQQADLPSTTLNGDILDTLDDLEILTGSFNLFILKASRGRRDQFTNWDRGFILRAARKTEMSYSGLAAKSADNNDRSAYEASITAEEFILPVRLDFSRQTTTEANALNSIVFCNEAVERSASSPAMQSCQIGYIGADAGAGVTANVLKTTDGGTWAATATDPFAADENISSVRCVETSRDTVRVFAFRGSTDVAAPAELAYSDNAGATWTLVNIGATNGDFVPFDQSVFVFDLNNIWVGTDLGYLYKSEDGGLTWTAQESGVITVDQIRAVHFADRDTGAFAGENNVIAATTDGGSTWSELVLPVGQATDEVNTVFVLDQYRFWVGYSDGTIYYTLDGGDTWSQRSYTGSGAGQVKQIVFLNDLQGYLAQNTAAPVGYIHQTMDGGYSWERVTLPTNTGINALVLCDGFKAFAVGEAQASTGVILKGIN